MIVHVEECSLFSTAVFKKWGKQPKNMEIISPLMHKFTALGFVLFFFLCLHLSDPLYVSLNFFSSWAVLTWKGNFVLQCVYILSGKFEQ